ncbi:MAG: protein translocase subunit SecD [Candidatus Caldarchaeum sp.]
MRRASRGWIATILVITFLSVIFLIPTVMGDSLPSWWGKVFPHKGLRLGLDLKGGIYLLMGVQDERAVEHELGSLKESLTSQLKEKGILVKGISVNDSSLIVRFFSKEDLARAEEVVGQYKDIANIVKEDEFYKLNLKDEFITESKRKTIDQVVQIIKNRVDEFGVLEPAIQRVGANRILIQVPGASATDRERIIGIIKRSAVLEFKIVKDVAAEKSQLLAKYGIDPSDPKQVQDAPKTLAQNGLAIYPGDEEARENEKFFVTELDAPVTGEYLSDARLTFDTYGRPAVGFGFRGEGATKFGELTEKNIGRRLAIVLDGVVKSAPTINDRITSSGIITGRFTLDEARDLALVLRSGALPVPVDILEERTVGPSLGKDSIDKGILSMAVGGALVVLFMVFYYRLQGVIANIALAINLLFILGFLSAFGVTLTLPGIAGLVLTLGMAVDGNIIIFERIKEELASGKSPLSAIEAGYDRSLWTLLDANITTLLTALILFWFGTGPIKGFAVALSIGIASTVFSNIVVAKVLTDLIYEGRRTATISI